METRNIAIMLTDIKKFTSKTGGFSRAQTQELLAKHRELVLPVIERFGGRLVKTIGDAVDITARLESIAEAVYLAMNKREVPSSEIGCRQFKGVPEK